MNILRAITPFVDRIIRIFNGAQCDMIGALERKPPFEVNMNYPKFPDIDRKTVLIAYPMLAMGLHLMKY